MKQFILLLFCVLSVFPKEVFPQYDVENLRKYWYYRYRLINDFVKIGSNRGESIPARIRTGTKFGAGELKWGDATITLGEYISVLATE